MCVSGMCGSGVCEWYVWEGGVLLLDWTDRCSPAMCATCTLALVELFCQYGGLP